ncbi:uncharacterized protein KY384_004304 [Bacidia gigantensis]|uniref:uncharacterized protein n=1 Tax=Bacidia gigantensis TaxID=2732470 RepID=UPI001D047555|nr:uncharacterized protein KY384_004304 [Bacidia gigantensis]KAG8530947.1 hypothetical protein KY384_004304 [Bacidia gigantensis]
MTSQFVDPLILMRVIRTEAHRRLAFLIAEKSMRRKFIGAAARIVGAVPVGRALDSTKPASGRVYAPDPTNDSRLIRGVGTRFESEAQIGGLIVLPSINGNAANAEILEVMSDQELRLKKDFKEEVALKQLTGRPFDSSGDRSNVEASNQFKGINFKFAPKVDQSKVYDAVFDRLRAGGCVGIFPEGGSHDRTELLPLKAGVAIMALGSLAANPDSGLTIVPCGMNYFHAHKFRSRAVVEFGNPVEIPVEYVELYKKGERRDAIGRLLDLVYQALVTVTVTTPDYETLMMIHAARRLYNPPGKKLPLPMVVELNRRLVQGYTHYQDDPRIIDLKKSVNEYNKQLWRLGVRDHQVEYARFSVIKVVVSLFYRSGKLAVLALGTVPGLFLFAPVFAASKLISIKKSREALAASTVKLEGRDVIATWKLLVSMALAPSLYAFYSAVLTYWTYKNRVQGYVPLWVPLWFVPIPSIVFFISITFAALRFGEIGMDIFKSLRPLILSLNPSSANTLVRLRKRREVLAEKVTDMINTLGPEMFPDFDSTRIVADPFHDLGAFKETGTPKTPTYTRTPPPGQPTFSPPIRHSNSASIGGGTSNLAHLPRNESLHNLGSISLFASRPPSRSRSRSNSSGGLMSSSSFPLQRFSTLDSKEGLDEVSKKIRGAMRERGKQRRKSEENNGAGIFELTMDDAESDRETPENSEGRKET